MKICPTCGREYPDNVKFCQADGATLRGKAASSDLVGQVVADRYHIIKKLGEGGMGAVYLGEHVKMGRKSAIKVMMASMANDPDAVARFNREASNASRISHPNVCQIFDFGETADGLIYLAMEFIEGKSLKDLVEHEGAIPAVRAAAIIRQSADALQAAHDLGIVHRDIKPDNIMIVQGRDGSDVVKVVDFGIARAGNDEGQKVTKTGLVVGTPEYMSPEQLSGDKLDGRSDIYSLGLVLYRMVTGTLPFQADSAQETMIKRLTDDPMPLADARTDIEFPPKLQLVMNTALARSASERYQSASEFGRDVMDAVAGMAMPSTRVQQAHEGATHVMSKEELTAATKAQSAPAKKSAAPPAKKRETPPTAAPMPAKKGAPVGMIVGAGGGLVAIAAVAMLMMKKPAGNGATGADTTGRVAISPTPAPVDSSKLQTVTPNPPPGNNPPGTSRTQPVQQQNVRPNNPPPSPNPPPPTTSGVNVEDSLNAAINADKAGNRVRVRLLGRWVYSSLQATNDQKAEAAELVATTYDDDNDRALEWLRNGLQYATGNRRTRIQNAINTLSGTP